MDDWTTAINELLEHFRERDYIDFLIQLAEAGHTGARYDLYSIWEHEENRDPRLEPYSKPPRTKSRNQRTGRPRGRPPRGASPPGSYIPNIANHARNFKTMDSDLRIAVALELARRRGLTVQAAIKAAADQLFLSEGRVYPYKTRKWREAARRVLGDTD
jgi:hypothetical protein